MCTQYSEGKLAKQVIILNWKMFREIEISKFVQNYKIGTYVGWFCEKQIVLNVLTSSVILGITVAFTKQCNAASMYCLTNDFT